MGRPLAAGGAVENEVCAGDPRDMLGCRHHNIIAWSSAELMCQGFGPPPQDLMGPLGLEDVASTQPCDYRGALGDRIPTDSAG